MYQLFMTLHHVDQFQHVTAADVLLELCFYKIHEKCHVTPAKTGRIINLDLGHLKDVCVLKSSEIFATGIIVVA